MTGLTALIKRNCKLFFKDKGMFFSTLITPVILLCLYIAFLGNIFRETFNESMPEGFSGSLVEGIVGGQLLSSILAVCCVTVAFCSNLLMVQDKANNSIKDLTITPVKSATLALSYYLSTLLVTLIICFISTGICFAYIGSTGWYMSVTDVLLILFDTFLLTMFGTALSSIVNFFLTTQGQMSAVGTIVSCSYGFICGAYMPISQFGSGLQNVIAFLPGTYGTSLVRNHALNGVLQEMTSLGVPADVISGIRDSVDCNLYFYGTKVETWTMYLILAGTVAALVGIYVLMNVVKGSKSKIAAKKEDVA